MAPVHVELVSVERLLWSGDATMVIARTTEGELGVLPGHAPLLGELAPGGVVRIQQEGGDPLSSTAEQYAKDIDQEERKWSALIKKLNLRVE